MKKYTNNKEKIQVACFIKIKTGKTTSIINRLKEIDEVIKIQSITGEYDILIEIEADTPDDLYDIYSKEIDVIPGVKEVHSHYIVKTWDKR